MSKSEELASKLEAFAALDGGDIADVEQSAAHLRAINANRMMLLEALTDLYRVAEVRREEDYFAVTNAAAALEQAKALS